MRPGAPSGETAAGSQKSRFSGPHWIVNFPTKKHWRYPSKREWVVEGLKDLRAVIAAKGIRSVAIPPLGSGNGGLEWTDVRPLIEAALGDMADVDIVGRELVAGAVRACDADRRTAIPFAGVGGEGYARSALGRGGAARAKRSPA